MKCPQCHTPMLKGTQACPTCGRKRPSAVLSTVGCAVGLVFGYLYTSTLLVVLLLAFVVSLVMKKVFHMQGPEQVICLLADVQALYVMTGYFILLALGELGPALSVFSAGAVLFFLLLDGLFALGTIVLAGLFYARKSRLLAILLIALESLYLVVNLFTALTNLRFDPSQAGSAFLHVLWRGAVIFLLVRWLRALPKTEPALPPWESKT